MSNLKHYILEYISFITVSNINFFDWPDILAEHSSLSVLRCIFLYLWFFDAFYKWKYLKIAINQMPGLS